MRRITLSRLALPLILLGLNCLAAAQNVSIELTPITYPIVLPDSGGSFDYLLTVTNQGGSPITATVWCMATLPNGGSWGPALGPLTQTLGGSQTQSIRRTQTIPPRAPYGYYMLRGYVGIYPDTVWAQDQFEFQHQAISGTERLWSARYNGPGNYWDESASVAVDGFGNVYVTGKSFATNYDYATIRYDSFGAQQWVVRYNSPGNSYNEATSLAVDEDGNVYVTGTSYGSGTSADYATIKYNLRGEPQWIARYNGPESLWDYAYSLAVDGEGNVYVTGTSGGVFMDYATIKYNSVGAQQWVARYSGLGYLNNNAYSLAVDQEGNVYVTGRSDGPAGGGYYDYATIKYDPNGYQMWAARYNGPGNDYDEATSLVLDWVGNVYVTGWSVDSETSYDYATIMYNSAGAEQWVARYNGPGNGYDKATSLAVDGDRNVYVTGWSAGSETSHDYATIKYNSVGAEQWVARYNGPGNGSDEATSLAVDEAGNLYVTGRSYDGGISYDYATIKYNSAGVEQWVARYNGPGNGPDWAHSLAVDRNGSVYVTGQSYGGSATYYDFATIKYSGGNIANWMPVEATVFGQPLPQECRLEGNFPNPFNAATVIRYKMQDARNVSLRVYDTAGRLVETLVDGYRQAGEHELTWDAGDLAAGIYFAKLKAGNYVGVQKLILLK